MTIPSNLVSGGKMPAAQANLIIGPTAIGLVATGSAQASALQLTADVNAVTTSSASTGVRLPACEKGAMVVVENKAGQALNVYPFETTGVTVNGTTSVSQTSAKAAIFFGTGVNWVYVLSA